MNCYLVSLVVFTLIVSKISAKYICNDDCLTKTYCLSSSGSTSCYPANLVKAKWSVSQVSNYDVVTLKLSAKNVNLTEIRTLSLAFKNATNPLSLTNYTCFKSASGFTPSVTQKTSKSSQVIATGVSSFTNGELSCSWSFSMFDNTWPLYNDGIARLTSDKRGIIELKSGNSSAVVGYNVEDLPIYQLKYLECCNKVHGDSGYKVMFNQTKENSYLVRTAGRNPNLLTLSFNNSNGMMLNFTCNFARIQLDGFVGNKTKSTSITNLIYEQYVYSSYDSLCYWSHSLVLSGEFGKLDTTKGVFDMKIVSDGTVVYTEKGVTFKNSASQLSPCISVMFTITSVIFLLNFP